MIKKKDKIKKRMKAMAIIDIILSPEWEYRCFMYDKKWYLDNDEEMASIKNNHGDCVYILFLKNNIIGKTVSDDSSLKVKELSKNNRNNDLKYFISEPAFITEYYDYFFTVSDFDIKILYGEKKDSLFDMVIDVEKYFNWLLEYYEIQIDKKIILELIEKLEINEKIALAVNPECVWCEIRDEINDIV